jgi:uncharacterized protein (TIGR02145 family)
MQSWNNCAAYKTPATTGYTLVGTLKDSRDNKTYEVRKFADGKCWMVDNLRYGGSTDACGSKATYYGSSNYSGAAWGYGDCRNSGDTSYGYLYNWQAVMQHASAYYQSTYTGPIPAQGICPTGWHVPTGAGSGEFYALHVAAGSPATGFWQGGSWKGVYSGWCSNDGTLDLQGSYGYYWAGTPDAVGDAYRLSFNVSSVNAGYMGYQFYGHPVRCVKD